MQESNPPPHEVYWPLSHSLLEGYTGGVMIGNFKTQVSDAGNYTTSINKSNEKTEIKRKKANNQFILFWLSTLNKY